MKTRTLLLILVAPISFSFASTLRNTYHDNDSAKHPVSIEFETENTDATPPSIIRKLIRRWKRRRGKSKEQEISQVDSIKVFQCNQSLVKCEYRPKDVLNPYRCNFEGNNAGFSRTIKIYDCGGYHMKCEALQNSLKYPCKFVNLEALV